MPMLRRISTISGPACDIHNPALSFILLPMQHCPPAQNGAGCQVDLHCPFPIGAPIGFGLVERIILEHARIVDEDIDSPRKFIQRGFPKLGGAIGLREIKIRAGNGKNLGICTAQTRGNCRANAA